MPDPLHAEAITLLPGQYEDSSHLRNLLRALVGATTTHTALEEVEDVLQSLLTDLWLGVAVGQQLDTLGAILGCARGGMTDAAYRFRLWIQVGINSGNGHPEQIITVLNLLWSPVWVQIRESYPINTTRGMYACVRLAPGAVTPAAETTDWLQPLAPGGVALWFTSAVSNVPFGTFEDSLADGFDEVSAMHVPELHGGCFVELWPHAVEV